MNDGTRLGRDAAFLARVDKRSPEACWPWTGTLKAGYGRFLLRKGKRVPAHRWAYERFVGPIPDGLTIDHLCHDPWLCAGGERCPHRRCVNPAHLAPATDADNTLRGNSPSAVNARKIQCDHGHDFTPENTRTRDGHRECLTCMRLRNQRQTEARRELNGASAAGRRDPEAGFFARVGGGNSEGCWPWTGEVVSGYGKFWVGGKREPAHRWSYERFVAAVPDGLQIVHLCHDPAECEGGTTCPHRRCVNPDHLTTSASSENDRGACSTRGVAAVNAAKTHCDHGHEFTPANTQVTVKRNGRPRRYCRECQRQIQQRLAAAKRAERATQTAA